MSSSPQQKAAQEPQHIGTSGTQLRAPIVVVMGHVDHGKTSLLDYVRKTRVAEREAGGITQAVGAYEIDHGGKRITFIDTPGHEAFTKMRQRGASIADVAILMIAADDGVKPQTKEAIDILLSAKIPFLVAINKIDKNNADEERTKNDLLNNGVALEKLGGDVPWVAISAKEGTGVDELLDTLLLLWDVQEVTCDPSAPARGFILESHRDSQRGPVASLIIKDGTLRVGDRVTTASAEGKVRSLENFLGESVKELGPSSPALIAGFSDVPMVGELCVAGELEPAAKESLLPQEYKEPEQEIAQVKSGEQTIKLVLKADVSGTLEALSHVIGGLSFENREVVVVSREVGDITDGDVKLASSVGAYVIGFNVKVAKAAQNVARSEKVRIITSNIIYRIIEALEHEVSHSQQEQKGGALEILAVFSQQGKKQVVGGKMKRGILALGDHIVVMRGEEEIGHGTIRNLQQGKENCKKVLEGECGMMIESPETIIVGDVIKMAE